MTTCVFCGTALHPDGKRTYREMTGWAKPRTKGGVNALVERKSTDRYACSSCIDLRKAGIHVEQQQFPI